MFIPCLLLTEEKGIRLWPRSLATVGIAQSIVKWNKIVKTICGSQIYISWDPIDTATSFVQNSHSNFFTLIVCSFMYTVSLYVNEFLKLIPLHWSTFIKHLTFWCLYWVLPGRLLSVIRSSYSREVSKEKRYFLDTYACLIFLFFDV